MNKFSLRLYFLLCSLVSWAGVSASKEEDDELYEPRRRAIDELVNPMEEIEDFQSLDVSISLIIWVIVLIIACYVFGKIWKGCTYLLILFAAVIYFLTH